MLKRMTYALVLLTVLYLMYLTKSAMGIELSHRFSAPRVFKLPIQGLLHHS